MVTLKDLRSLSIMDTGTMEDWWDNALDNWAELCYEESYLDGESRDLPCLPDSIYIDCYVRVNIDGIKENSGGKVKLVEYISACNSNRFVPVKFAEGIKYVSVDDVVLWNSDINLTIEYIRDGFFDNLRKHSNAYHGYTTPDGNLIAITKTENDSGNVSVLFADNVSYEKTFGISLERIRDYLYDEESSWNYWSEEKLRA